MATSSKPKRDSKGHFAPTTTRSKLRAFGSSIKKGLSSNEVVLLVREAKREHALANTAIAKARRAAEAVHNARTKAEQRDAQTRLKVAKMERQRREVAAKTALENAKAALAQAKAAHQTASNQKWQSRFNKIQTVEGGVRKMIPGLVVGYNAKPKHKGPPSNIYDDLWR